MTPVKAHIKLLDEAFKVMAERHKGKYWDQPLTRAVFATTFLLRDESTLRKWRRGAHPIPKVVVQWCRGVVNGTK
jgi:hypothetical protein